MDRLKKKYFISHLSVSVILITFVTVLCISFWFPVPFLSLDGTWIALVILAVVDIALGPLITLIVVSEKKSARERLLDLLFIGALQITALSYGLFQIEQERVWAIVHLDGAFNIVTKKEISQEKLNNTYNLPSYRGVYYAMVLNSDLPSHTKKTNQPLLYSPDRFQAISQQQMTSKVIYKNLPELIKRKYSEKHLFKILVGKKRNAVIIFDDTLTIIEIFLLPHIP